MGYMFYKHYFNTIQDDEFLEIVKKKNNRDENKIKQVSQNLERKFQALRRIKPTIIKHNPIAPLRNATFELSTTYPGLLLGSGYIHSVASVDGDLALGFDFDYTSGLPIIRGSSIKGVIRSVFPTKNDESKKTYIQSIIGDIDVNALRDNLFEDGKNIFFDAVITHYTTKKEKFFNKKLHKNETKEIINLIEEDYITPHNNELKNPIPIRFLKVAPEVTFEFSFSLDDKIISKAQKEKLIKQIILDFGLGAKTNVGYGKFLELRI